MAYERKMSLAGLNEEYVAVWKEKSLQKAVQWAEMTVPQLRKAGRQEGDSS